MIKIIIAVCFAVILGLLVFPAVSANLKSPIVKDAIIEYKSQRLCTSDSSKC